MTTVPTTAQTTAPTTPPKLRVPPVQRASKVVDVDADDVVDVVIAIAVGRSPTHPKEMRSPRPR